MWAECLGNDPLFKKCVLAHTNSVYIFDDNGIKVFIVYVNDSTVLTELNARREWIALEFKKKFNEDIDEFKINISKGSYRKNLPYKERKNISYQDKTSPIPLTKEELSEVEEIATQIESEELRKKFIRAAVRDMEWKKGQKNL